MARMYGPISVTTDAEVEVAVLQPTDIFTTLYICNAGSGAALVYVSGAWHPVPAERARKLEGIFTDTVIKVRKATPADVVNLYLDFGGEPTATFSGETKTIAAAAVPEPLVNQRTPCKFVWVGAPCSSAGDATNTKPVFVGDANNQNIPIMPSNFEGMFIEIDDASKVYVRVGVDGESISYRVFS